MGNGSVAAIVSAKAYRGRICRRVPQLRRVLFARQRTSYLSTTYGLSPCWPSPRSVTQPRRIIVASLAMRASIGPAQILFQCLDNKLAALQDPQLSQLLFLLLIIAWQSRPIARPLHNMMRSVSVAWTHTDAMPGMLRYVTMPGMLCLFMGWRYLLLRPALFFFMH